MATDHYYTILRVFCNLLAPVVIVTTVWGMLQIACLANHARRAMGDIGRVFHGEISDLVARECRAHVGIDRIPLGGYNAPGFQAEGVLEQWGYHLAIVSYVGHATVVVDIGRIRVLTDPLLRDRVLFLQRHGWNPARALLGERAPDIVLLSHLHYDHADLPSLRSLPSTTTIIAPRGSGRYLERWAGVQVHEVAEGDKVQVADVEITALPAKHGQALSVPRPMDTCLSYVMRNRLSIYFAGDTDLFDGMHNVGQDFDLDLALLPVWGYSPRVGTGHLTPLTAAQALNRLQPAVAVPIHWGSFRFLGPDSFWRGSSHLSIPPYAFAEYASQMAPQTEVRVLQPGEKISLN